MNDSDLIQPDDYRGYRLEPADQRTGLSLLLSNRVDPKDPAVGPFVQFARTQGLDLRELWVAEEAGAPRVAALMVPGEGRTMMMLLSAIGRDSLVPYQAALIRQMVRGLSPDRIRLVQALLDLHQHHARQALIDAGFTWLANLAYMDRKDLVHDEHARLGFPDERLTIHHWSEANRPIFEAAIQASYIETQDCPGLLGVRDIHDVIAGHKSSGLFDPETWFAVERDGEPVGVMLLNVLSGRRAVELVYLGLAPSYRRKGYAWRLMQYGMSLAAGRGAKSMLVAVDERNDPAVRLYRRLGFTVNGRKAALILALR